MNDPENFLKRWSRRKRDAVKVSARSEARRSRSRRARKSSRHDRQVRSRAATPETPAFDLSKLPSLDSITADTDITAFLQPGVPAALNACGASPRLGGRSGNPRLYRARPRTIGTSPVRTGFPASAISTRNLDVKRLIARACSRRGRARTAAEAGFARNRQVGSASSDEQF